jgi:hypothetical protein
MFIEPYSFVLAMIDFVELSSTDKNAIDRRSIDSIKSLIIRLDSIVDHCDMSNDDC